jgi:hypothetical protein
MNFLKSSLFCLASSALTLLLLQAYALASPNPHRGSWLFIISEGTQLSFDYKSSSTALLDKEEVSPIGIRIKLPLGLIKNTVTDNCAIFYYPNKQAIIILASKNEKKDTVVTASLENFNKYILSIPISNEQEDSFNKYHLSQKRKTVIVTKGRFDVMLYNVKDSSLKDFIRKAKTVQSY